jgi:hypothetical protein
MKARSDGLLAANPPTKELTMKTSRMLAMATVAGAVAAIGSWGIAAQDKYTVQVPNGLAVSEFRGYEAWQVVSVSHNGGALAAILANPVMIEAFKAGIPGNGQPFPDGSKMAKVHWTPKNSESFPSALVAGTQHDVDFMAKDSRRFADSGGWGYGAFEYNASSDSFRPANQGDAPPQGDDAKCGFGCHTIVKARDYVFTEYAHR